MQCYGGSTIIDRTTVGRDVKSRPADGESEVSPRCECSCSMFAGRIQELTSVQNEPIIRMSFTRDFYSSAPR